MSIKSPLQIQRDEHDESSLAKKTTEVSLSTWKTSNLTLTTANIAYLLPATEMAERKTLVVYNASDTTIYFGDSSVTTSSGIILSSLAVLTTDAVSGIYAVCGTNNKTVNILEGK